MRDLPITRQEAELLTDLLMLSDDWQVSDLDASIRELWGMIPREQELESRRTTVAAIRREWAKAILEGAQ